MDTCCELPNPRVDRRVFVKAGGLALVALGLDPIFLTRTAYAVQRRAGLAVRESAGFFSASRIGPLSAPS